MSKKSLKERLAQRRKEIKERSSGMKGVFFIKEGKTRFRILPVTDEDEDFSFEATHFYLGSKIKGFFSAASIGEECPINDYYEELKDSSREADRENSAKFPPRKKYLVPAIVYKDERGREVDKDKGVILVQLPTRTYGEIIDAYLDPDLGDFTDFEDGYDFKVTRTGKGKMDTEYTISPMRPSKTPKEFAKPVDLQEMVNKIMPSEEDAERILEQWKAILEDGEDPDEDEGPRKKKGKRVKRKRGDA